MVVKTLRPARFYGGSLPRPFIYSDVKYSEERVDPPVSVNDPLLSWANEAHWSMGGLSFDRTRLMGKIEGNVEKLRKEKEKILKKNPKVETPIAKFKGKGGKSIRKREEEKGNSPPPAPRSKKLRLRSRVVDVEHEDGDEDEEEAVVEAGRKRRRLVRKLGEEFELVADDKVKGKGMGKGEDVGSRRMTKRRNMVLMDDGEESDVEKEVVVTVKEARSSPRLKK